MQNLALQCECGQVRGVVEKVTPASGNRLTCYCSDCQAFAHHVRPNGGVLNAQGGTEVFQVSPAAFKIHQGLENLACVRLTENGLYRWYTTCCNTPVGNTVGSKLPFVGIVHSFIAKDQDWDGKMGPMLGSVNLKGATGNVSADIKGPASKNGILFRVLRKILFWKLFGKNNPNTLFKTGKPIVEPKVLS